jgi:hypothetical protein
MTKVKVQVLMRGNCGDEVATLKMALRKTLGESANNYPGLNSGNEFDIDTETALRAWQAATGLVADGIAGPRNLTELNILPAASLDRVLNSTLASRLFPNTRNSNISKNLPYVTAALAAFNLTDINMISAALATIRAETEGFVPIAELPSHFNTLPGQAAFSAYEHRMGNQNSGDGARYRGRGYVQLTGCNNYREFGERLDIPLIDNPDCACSPEVAACLLAAYLAANREKLLLALANNDLNTARKIVNGGNYGLARFSETYLKAQQLLTARPLATATRTETPIVTRQSTLNVGCDPEDLRDRPYLPPPHSLPQCYPSDIEIKSFISAYNKAGLILDQGQEGACTGFGLACVINYLQWRSAGMPDTLEPVSPRMLYHFALRYDEYEGEDYSGSSCRGALKGWYHNGVCRDSMWTYQADRETLPHPDWDSDAIERTLGVYYRLDLQTISDLQAAIMEVGAIFVSAYTHPGWERLTSCDMPPASHTDLPVIDYDGHPSRSGGHAFALVGFNRTGFVLQNSWGGNWGAGGFAIIRYSDWLANAMDAWVAALGVPGVVSGRLITSGKNHSGVTGSAHANWWDETQAYQHSIVLGNNGRVNQFDKPDGITRTLQHQACILPDNWFRQNPQLPVKRIVIYAHGGLNSESAALGRARAMGRYFTGNGCYPLFLVWKSGLFESLADILKEKSTADSNKTGGIRDWLNDKISDPVVEKTIGRPFARPLWTEMKENAELAAESGRGGDLLTDALHSLAGSWGDNFEIHLIGHSAGSIMLGKLLTNLAQKDLTRHVKTVHLYAPACSVAFANRYYAPHEDIMQRLYLDILADRQEQDDNVAYIYQKSLLYFVSNALESDAHMPILGMANVYDNNFNGWDGTSTTAEALTNWRNAVEISRLNDRITLHDEKKFTTRGGLETKTEPPSHGGFDNNIAVIGKTLERITGAPLTLPVDDLVGF